MARLARLTRLTRFILRWGEELFIDRVKRVKRAIRAPLQQPKGPHFGIQLTLGGRGVPRLIGDGVFILLRKMSCVP